MKRDILYVDDEMDNIIVFETAFEDEFNIHTAASGQEALAILDRMPIPVVVADQRMPEMTGVELFEIVRQKHPHSKRILLTGYTEPDAMLDAINKGRIFYFIKKPWERPMLLAVLIRALEAYDLSVANTALTDRLIASERGALLGRATARITHEMGNQLSILPLIELIESNYSDQEELVKIAHFARETYDRLVALIQEVKDFMRVEHEQFTKQPLSLAETVHDLVSFLRFDNTIPHEQFTLQVHADAVILANKIKVQQVIVNLLKNAAHAIRERPDGRIELTIDRDGDDAVLQVSDTGCGMSAEVLDRIWEPYFTTKGEEGNGLGLDISRQLIEGHGGTISCDSLLDVGTTFTIRMPTIELHNQCVSVNG
jgi:signal transduction histidine kinase